MALGVDIVHLFCPRRSGGKSAAFRAHFHAVVVRHDPGSVVGRRSRGRNRCLVTVAAGYIGQPAYARHLVADGLAAVDSLGVQLDLHRLRVEVIKSDLDLSRTRIAERTRVSACRDQTALSPRQPPRVAHRTWPVGEPGAGGCIRRGRRGRRCVAARDELRGCDERPAPQFPVSPAPHSAGRARPTNVRTGEWACPHIRRG